MSGPLSHTASLPAGLRRAARPALPAWARFVALELALWAGLYAGYLAIRAVAIAGEDGAMANARHLVELERVTGLLVEPQAQALLEPLHGLFSAYYMLAFGPVVAATLVWLAARRRDVYRELSRSLLLAIAVASIVFVVFPAAPPRLLPELGIADTVGLAGAHDTGSFAGVRFNPYAAMPSMHVGWSLLVGIALFRVARRRATRVAAAAHPVVMTATVVATGNHYLVDAVAGAAIALVALAIVRRYATSSRPAAAEPAGQAVLDVEWPAREGHLDVLGTGRRGRTLRGRAAGMRSPYARRAPPAPRASRAMDRLPYHSAPCAS